MFSLMCFYSDDPGDEASTSMTSRHFTFVFLRWHHQDYATKTPSCLCHQTLQVWSGPINVCCCHDCLCNYAWVYRLAGVSVIVTTYKVSISTQQPPLQNASSGTKRWCYMANLHVLHSQDFLQQQGHELTFTVNEDFHYSPEKTGDEGWCKPSDPFFFPRPPFPLFSCPSSTSLTQEKTQDHSPERTLLPSLSTVSPCHSWTLLSIIQWSHPSTWQNGSRENQKGGTRVL